MMKPRVCPVWVGYLLLNPLRKLLENPVKMFSPYLKPGMFVLEPGCGPGYFTLPLAEMVGPEGRVICLDVQDRMLDIVRRRAGKAGLADRIELRVVEDRSLGCADLMGRIDLAVAMHMVHEVPDPEAFLGEVFVLLKPGGRLFVTEPKGHTTDRDYEEMLSMAGDKGLQVETSSVNRFVRKVVFIK
jgi:ubiquinone/menaquinone biosynthesis C-methylase UbiE